MHKYKKASPIETALLGCVQEHCTALPFAMLILMFLTMLQCFAFCVLGEGSCSYIHDLIIEGVMFNRLSVL